MLTPILLFFFLIAIISWLFTNLLSKNIKEVNDHISEANRAGSVFGYFSYEEGSQTTRKSELTKRGKKNA